MELLRAYQTLHELHPIVGYAFAGVAGVCVIWSVGRLLGGWAIRPRTLHPPEVDDLDQADLRTLVRYGRYLIRYLRRLSRNEQLGEQQRRGAAEAADRVSAELRERGGRDRVLALLKATEADEIEPLLSELDSLAEQEVRECVLHVMIGVAASPWDAIDLLIVLYRNGGMIARITQVYNSFPPLRERLLVFVDTLRMVLMIKFASLTGTIVKNSKGIPLLGRVLKPLMQAVGSGVLTSVAGHAAMQRCRAFRGWNRQEAAKRLDGMGKQYLRDCWGAAVEHTLPILREKLSDIPSAAWTKIREGFGAAIDATAGAADSFVRKPVAAGVDTIANGGRYAYLRTRLSVRRVFRRRRRSGTGR